MTPQGDSFWVSGFRDVADQLIPHIVALLPACVGSLGSSPKEDSITQNLVSRLSASAVVREIAVLEYQFHPFQFDAEGNSLSRGRIDFVAYSDGLPSPVGISPREVYLAYECKRLNVPTATGRRHLVSEYVEDGVRRFVSGQYASHLPFSCMLGYVIDGDVADADRRVRNSMRSKALSIAMLRGPLSLSKDGSCVQFETFHRQSGSDSAIEMRHILVSCIG